MKLISDSSSVALKAGAWTGQPAAAAHAAGLSAWVQSITGQPTRMVRNPDRTVTLLLSPEQHAAMRQWVHGLVWEPKEPGAVSIELGPTWKPLAMQYGLPAAGAAILVGWLIGRYL